MIIVSYANLERRCPKLVYVTITMSLLSQDVEITYSNSSSLVIIESFILES